jgi:hypothetical protein
VLQRTGTPDKKSIVILSDDDVGVVMDGTTILDLEHADVTRFQKTFLRSALAWALWE